MARHKSDNYDQVKAAIIDAAAEVFAEKKFRNTNIIEIGNACNASKSRLYHYYPSKEAMLFEMLQEHVTALVNEATSVFEQAMPIEARFAAYIRLHINYYLDNRAKHAVLLNDIENLPEEQHKEIRKLESRLVELMTKLLKELNPALFKKTHAAKTHAMLIYGMMNWTYTWYHSSGPINPEQLATYITDLCLKGLQER